MKKRVLWITGGCLVVVAAIVLIIFAFGGKEEPAPVTLQLDGTWKVAVYNNGSATIVDNEYMVFDSETAKDYRDNEVYVSSKYTIEGSELQLNDVSKKYTIEKKTDNYIRLYEDKSTYMELIRYQNSDMSPIPVTESLLDGKWNIIYRNTDKPYAGSYLTFENGTVGQYQSGSDNPAATSSYKITDNHLEVDGWGKEMAIYPLNDNTVIFVELSTDTGFIWELKLDK